LHHAFGKEGSKRSEEGGKRKLLGGNLALLPRNLASLPRNRAFLSGNLDSLPRNRAFLSGNLASLPRNGAFLPGNLISRLSNFAFLTPQNGLKENVLIYIKTVLFIHLKNNNMKRQPLLLIGFTKYSDSGLLIKANYIVSCMTGNTLYADAGTKLTDLGTAIETFSGTLTQKGKVLNFKELKTAARKDLIEKLQVLGIYVRDKYPGNASNWKTSGYDVQEFDGSTTLPATPGNAKVKDGTYSGEALVSYSRPKHTLYFEGRFWKTGEQPSTTIAFSSQTEKMIFSGLETATEYNFQVRARGTKGVSDWINPLIWVVR